MERLPLRRHLARDIQPWFETAPALRGSVTIRQDGERLASQKGLKTMSAMIAANSPATMKKRAPA